MKKKIVAYFLIILIAMISLMGYSVEAKTLKITKKDYIKTGERTNTRFHTNKGYAFCITPRRNGPSEGTVLKYQSEKTTGGLIYLLERAKYSDDEYLSYQLAVWNFNSQYVPDYFVSHPNYNFVKRSKTLASEAAKNKNYKPKEPSLSIKASSSNLSLTSDGKYYKSGVITVNASNISGNVNYSLVNAPSGAKIESDGTKNYIVVPAASVSSASTITFKATAKGNVNKVERYTTGNSNLQDLIVLVPVEKTVSQSVNLTVTPVKRSCEVVDGNYYDENGNITDKEGYEAHCIHKCVRYNNEYYDENGNVTDEATFELTCKKHSCEVVGDHYFDKDGNDTTYENYSISCERHVCESFGGKYFGKDGVEVPEENYLHECVHVCEIYDNEYYGSQGTKVTEAEYKAQCEAQIVPVPDTGSEGLISVLIGAALLGGLGGAINHYRKVNS